VPELVLGHEDSAEVFDTYQPPHLAVPLFVDVDAAVEEVAAAVVVDAG
jgi:hypothetical protein